MELSRNPEIHHFGKNELGDQLQYALFQMRERARGIEVALRIFGEAFYHADGSGNTVDQYDLSDVHNLIAWCSNKLGDDLGRFHEALFVDQKTDFTEILNRYDAEKDFPYISRPADSDRSG